MLLQHLPAVLQGCLFILIVAELIIDRVFDIIGEILLLHIVAGEVVGILVKLSLDRRVRAVIVLVLELAGKAGALSRPDIRQGRVHG